MVTYAVKHSAGNSCNCVRAKTNSSQKKPNPMPTNKKSHLSSPSKSWKQKNNEPVRKHTSNKQRNEYSQFS